MRQECTAQWQSLWWMQSSVKWDIEWLKEFDGMTLRKALAAIRDVGPGGHYLGHQHTMENFQRAFFMPKLFDNNSVEQWQADGSKDTIQRGLEGAKKLLEDYQEPKAGSSKR